MTRAHVLLREKETRIAARLLLIESLEERHAVIESIGRASRALPPEPPVCSFDVPECNSGLHVSVFGVADSVRFFPVAQTAYVRGLARLVCSIYDGESPANLLQFQPAVLELVGLWAHLSPIRQQGMLGLTSRLQTALSSIVSSPLPP